LKGWFERDLNQDSLLHDYTGEINAGEASFLGVPDVALIAQIARGDEDAFAELYRRYSGLLYNFLYRLVNDQPAAEDLLQEVFLAIWKGAGRFRQMASVKTWLFNIAYKQGISWLRKRRELPVEDFDHMPASDNPEQSAVDRADRELILQAFNQLSLPHRTVLELVLYYEMPYAEVAQVLGCPVGTVKSRLSYARKQLAALISLRGLGLDPQR
jgi:RNA polymerase sigma-70 factor, ECF subfamily